MKYMDEFIFVSNPFAYGSVNIASSKRAYVKTKKVAHAPDTDTFGVRT